MDPDGSANLRGFTYIWGRVGEAGWPLARCLQTVPAMRTLCSLAVLGAVAALIGTACGDASTPSSGYYRTGGQGSSGDTTDPGQSSGNTSSSGSTSSGSNASGSSGQTTSSSSGGNQAKGTFDVLLDKAAGAGDMTSTFTVQVTVAPKDGFAGKVDLKCAGLPTDATGTFDKPSLDISGTAGATATFTIKTKSTTPPDLSQVKITATSGTLSKDATYAMTINPKIEIDIKMNATINDFTDSKDITVATGGKTVTVAIKNLNSTGEIVHAGNPPDFPHGNTGTAIASNAFENQARSVKQGTNYTWYLHSKGDPGAANRAIIRAQ